jgi:hypothetical protein
MRVGNEAAHYESTHCSKSLQDSGPVLQYRNSHRKHRSLVIRSCYCCVATTAAEMLLPLLRSNERGVATLSTVACFA